MNRLLSYVAVVVDHDLARLALLLCFDRKRSSCRVGSANVLGAASLECPTPVDLQTCIHAIDKLHVVTPVQSFSASGLVLSLSWRPESSSDSASSIRKDCGLKIPEGSLSVL